MEGGIGSPQPGTETLPLGLDPEPAVLPFGSPACALPRCHLLTGRPWRLVGPAAR